MRPSPEIDPTTRQLYRTGGIAGLTLGIGYILIIPLYVSVGQPPSGGEAWLIYAAGKTAVWWAILGLSVLTDLLYVPVALGLYLNLARVGRNVVLFATGFVLLFVVVDLAVTWPNIASLISLTDKYAAASDAQRATYVAAANYASAVLTSTLEAFYSIAMPSVGILLFGLAMRRGGFGSGIAYVGIATGVVGLISVVGPFLVSCLGVAAVLASVLTTIWALVVGYKLYRL